MKETRIHFFPFLSVLLNSPNHYLLMNENTSINRIVILGFLEKCAGNSAKMRLQISDTTHYFQDLRSWRGIMTRDMIPGSFPIMGVKFLILAPLLFGFVLVPFVTAVSPGTLEAALPTAADVTSGLDMKNPPEITSQSDDPQFFFLIYDWDGYIRFACAQKSGRIDSNPGDWIQCRISAYSIDNAASAETLTNADVWREWIKGRVEPYTDYSTLPDSVWYRETRSPSETNYQVEEEIAFWIDPHTYIEVNVNSHVSSWSLYDELGCTPSVGERKSTMEALVDSEADRIAHLVRKNLVGGDESDLPSETPASPYDLLFSLLTEFIPEPWGMYQTSDKDLLMAALKEHDTEPDGATNILLTQFIGWYNDFQEEKNKKVDCKNSFYTASSDWLELVPVIAGLPQQYSDLIPLPAPIEALQRAAKTGKKTGEILRDKLNEEDYEHAYQDYRDYRSGSQSTTEDLSSAKNYVLSLPPGKSLELDKKDVDPLFDEFENRYLCEKRLEAIQKLKDNEHAIIAAKIPEYSADIQKIEKTFWKLLEEKRNNPQ